MGQRLWTIVWLCQMRIRRSLLKFPGWFQRCLASSAGVILEYGLSGTVSSKWKRIAMYQFHIVLHLDWLTCTQFDEGVRSLYICTWYGCISSWRLLPSLQRTVSKKLLLESLGNYVCISKDIEWFLYAEREHIGVLFSQVRRWCCASNIPHVMCGFVGYGVWTQWHGLLETNEDS